MADVIRIGNEEFKKRSPLGAWGLLFLTIGIYYFVWYYKINNELRHYGIENSPATATLAVTLGAIVIVPPFVSYYRTADRILKAQDKGQASERIIPVVGLILFVLFGGFAMPYYQTQLNKVWDAEAARGAPVSAA